MPLDFLLSMMRDEKATLAQRAFAATAAAPYLHFRLSAISKLPALDQIPTEILEKMIAEAQASAARESPQERYASLKYTVERVIDDAAKLAPTMLAELAEKLEAAGEAVREQYRSRTAHITVIHAPEAPLTHQ